MYMSARARLIMEYILTSKEAITTSALADYMSVSERTIRRDLKEIETTLQGFHLELQRENTILTIEGNEADKQAFKWQLLDLSYNEYTPLERQQYILKTILKSDEAVKLIALANDLGVTVATVSNDLTKMEEELDESVRIERKRGSGVRLIGTETAKRTLLTNLLGEQFSEANLFRLMQEQPEEEGAKQAASERLLHLIDRNLIQKVEKVLRNWRQQLEYQITDDAYISLVIHIVISIDRMLAGHFIYELRNENAKRYPEFQTAKEIIAECLEMEADVVPDGEAGLVTMHIRGAKALHYDSGDFTGNEHIQAVTVAKQLITSVEAKIDRRLDQQTLLKGLTAHLRPTLRRLHENMRIHNPLVKSIKQDYPELFDIVKAAFAEIYQSGSVPDEEIGYLVLHFGAAILQGNEEKVYSGIVVCASGIGTSRMLVTRLRQAISALKKLQTVSLFELPLQMKKENYDVIISTIDLGNVDFPYFFVSPMLTEREVSEIEVFLNEKQANYHRHADEEEINRQTTILETVHRLENKQYYISTIIDLLNNFQVSPIEGNSSDLEDTLRALCMRIMEKDREMNVEMLIKSLLSREKWSGFGITGTNLALFHARNSEVKTPIFQIFPLENKMTVPAMGGNNMDASTFVVLLAPEKFAQQGLEVMSYISAMLIESEQTTRILESADSSLITSFIIQKLNQFLNA